MKNKKQNKRRHKKPYRKQEKNIFIPKLRVFEAFAGIGAQHSALKRLGINFEISGISDWFIDAIECYAAIHHENDVVTVPQQKENVLKYLERMTFSKDSVHPCKLGSLSEDDLRDLYRSNKKCKNIGSILDIKPEEMPPTDLLVYSFPCQDLSTGGLGKGMKKGSGTRSGLLWEVERILNGLKDLNRLPEYLLLENVRTIKSDSNINDLNQWLAFLEKLGYQNDDCMFLNALDFGVPQDRERAFIVSHLGEKLNIPEKIKSRMRPREYRFEDFFRNDYNNPTLKSEADKAQLNKTPSREKMWEINGRELNANTIVRTITCNMDRTHCAALFPYNGVKGDSYRRPTIREAFLLMGFTEEEYERTLSLDYSYRKMNKLIGNSIVVNVLVAIFDSMFGDKYKCR
ncbi:MAG: DNA (cytosine-5-)-methyltransferase [Fibrobacter sp.]|nr:DNA (cytosine-5-)-methyltransferase [Fibrobacter sp.]